MFVPIVRRTVTVKSQGTFDFPFQCEACGLSTTAHVQVQGVGKASALYVSANADEARTRAQGAAQTNAHKLFIQCPCPQCGAPPRAFRDALARWEDTKVAKQKRRATLALVGLGAAVLSSGGCTALLVASDTTSKDTGTSIAAGLFISFFWFLLCAGVVGVVYALMGPGKRPSTLAQRPQNVWFDPPQAAPLAR